MQLASGMLQSKLQRQARPEGTAIDISTYLSTVGTMWQSYNLSTLLYKIFQICCTAIHAFVGQAAKPILRNSDNKMVRLSHTCICNYCNILQQQSAFFDTGCDEVRVAVRLTLNVWLISKPATSFGIVQNATWGHLNGTECMRREKSKSVCTRHFEILYYITKH